MQFSIEIKNLKSLLEKFNTEKINQAVHRAIRRATQKGKTVASQIIRERFNLRKSDVDRKIFTRVTTYGELTIHWEPISLMHFGAKEIRSGKVLYGKRIKGTRHYELITKKARKNLPEGVQVQILRGKITYLTKPIPSRHLSKPFIARGRGGTVLVFRRILNSKGPSGKGKLQAQKIISYAAIIRQRQNIQRLLSEIDQELNRECTRQLEKVLGPS